MTVGTYNPILGYYYQSNPERAKTLHIYVEGSKEQTDVDVSYCGLQLKVDMRLDIEKESSRVCRNCLRNDARAALT